MNLHIIKLQDWLAARSVKVEQHDYEVVFTHKTGETSIVLSSSLANKPTIPIESEPLVSLYRQYSGASIGDSQLIIGTNVMGGVHLSHNFHLPDLQQMTRQARELELDIEKDEHVFMAEAAWMFIYTICVEVGEPVLRKYDRDFGTKRRITDLDDILDAWWRMIQMEP